MRLSTILPIISAFSIVAGRVPKWWLRPGAVNFCYWGSIGSTRQPQLVGGFVHTCFEEVCFKMQTCGKVHCTTSKCVHKRHRWCTNILAPINYFIKQTFLNYIDQNGFGKPVGGSFQLCCASLPCQLWKPLRMRASQSAEVFDVSVSPINISFLAPPSVVRICVCLCRC